MNFAMNQPQPAPLRRASGFLTVVLLHVLIVYGLVSGLARKAVEVIKKPLETHIVEEVKLPPPPPPPPPPPKQIKQELPPPEAAPPPPYVPPPELTPPAVEAAPAIEAVSTPPVAPPPPIAPPVQAPPVVQRLEVGLACPGYRQTLQSALSGTYDSVGITGVVVVRARVRGSAVVEVVPQSGPREYYRPVANAVKRFQCSTSGAEEAVFTLEVAFREE